jgi:glucose/mannose-6-phosphate isomerase
VSGSDPLSREAVAAVDPAGMLDDVLAQPGQLADAVWRAESAGFPRAERAGGLAVAGMGGSAIGGDLAAAIVGERAARPLRTVRGYELEPWVGPDTLVLCASYSGDTEETLACFEQAGAAGAPRAVVTTGGELGEAARAQGVPVMGVPSGFQPRAAVVYMTVAALECAAACGAAPPLRNEAEGAAGLLGELVAEWGRDAGEDSEA